MLHGQSVGIDMDIGYYLTGALGRDFAKFAIRKKILTFFLFREMIRHGVSLIIPAKRQPFRLVS